MNIAQMQYMLACLDVVMIFCGRLRAVTLARKIYLGPHVEAMAEHVIINHKNMWDDFFWPVAWCHTYQKIVRRNSW